MKNNKVIPIILAVLIIAISSIIGIFTINTSILESKDDFKDDIKLLEDITLELFALSQYDINKYTLDYNFNNIKNNKDNNINERWQKSETYKYIEDINYSKFRTKISKDLIENLTNTIEEIHILNLNFIIENKIPEINEEQNSDIILDNYKDNLEDKTKKLNKDTINLFDKLNIKYKIYLKIIKLKDLNPTINKSNIKEKSEKYYQDKYNDKFERYYLNLIKLDKKIMKNNK